MSRFTDWLLGRKPAVEPDPSLYEPGPSTLPNTFKVPPTRHIYSGVILSPQQMDESTSEYADLRAVDTHSEVTFSYCQAGHLHMFAD